MDSINTNYKLKTLNPRGKLCLEINKPSDVLSTQKTSGVFNKVCKIEDCKRKVIYKNLCSVHIPYTREWVKTITERNLGLWRDDLCQVSPKKIDCFSGLKANHKLRKTWSNINSRCYYLKDKRYKYYGGKGIKNELQKSDLVYLWFRDKGYLMKYASIDRINPAGNYTRANCRFIEMTDNIRRRFNINL